MQPVVPEARSDARAIIYAKDQPEYKPLPANVQIPYTETKWALTCFANAIEIGRSAGRVGVEVCGLEFQVEPKGQASPTRGRRYDDCTQCGRSEASHANIIPGVPG